MSTVSRSPRSPRFSFLYTCAAPNDEDHEGSGSPEYVSPREGKVIDTSNDNIYFTALSPYDEFDNAFISPFWLHGKRWLSVEHYYQAQKFSCAEEVMEKIREMPTAAEAVEEAQANFLAVREDWEAVKLNVMRAAVQAKFFQNNELERKLLSTGERMLVNHTHRDNFWGDGGEKSGGTGLNMLGEILMELRADLRRPLPSSGFAAW